MKKIHLLLFLLPVFFLFAGAFSTAIYWSPTDLDAAWAWNLGIIAAPVIALFAQWRMAKERNYSLVLSLTLIAILNTAIVLGSRLGAWSSADWLQALSGNGLPDLPGKTIMGGILLMLLVFLLLKRWWRIPSEMADLIILGLPLAGLTARMGCLAAGCCYGIPTQSNWGIAYGPGTPAFMHQCQAGILTEGATHTALLFPIQLFLVAGNLLIFTALWHFRNKLKHPGMLACLGLGLLSLQRFGIEFFRDLATNRGEFGLMWQGLKLSQWVALLIGLSCLAGFLVLYLKPASHRTESRSNKLQVSITQQALALGAITIFCLVLNAVLSLDETMVILVSCLPALLIMGRQLWKERSGSKSVWAPVSLLSATALLLTINPLDSIPAHPMPKEGWTQWFEVAGGGITGNYKEISRDCDGNIVGVDVVKVGFGGAEFNSNWQKGWTKLQICARGAFGNAHTNENISTDNNYHYVSYGLLGRAESKWIGASLGVFRRQYSYSNEVGMGINAVNEYQPTGALRIGRVDRYSIDFRLFDEPTLGLANEPVFSAGLVNLGFKDPTGTRHMRAGLAFDTNAEVSLVLDGQFPIGNKGLSGSLSLYLGNASMFGAGLRYRFKER